MCHILPYFWLFCLFFFDGVVDISQTTLATVLAIKMCSHEDTGSTFLTRAFTSQTMDFSVIVYPVVFQHGQLYLLVLVFDLFGSGVILLLTFLSTTTETKHQVQGGFFLDVVVRKCAAIFQLLSGKDQTLLIWRNSLLILDLSLNIFDGI